jgi:rubrerythrin
MDVIRVSVGEGLPVPVRLMNFQKTRDFADGQRARELAKNNELGGPIRENLARQQQEMASNFDAFLDKTGAQIWQGREDRGIRVTNALEKMAAQDKARVRTLYNQAAKSADAQTKVPLNQLVPIQIGEDEIETTLLRYFTSQPTGVPSSGTVDAARQFAVNLGVLSKNEAGDLIAANPTVKNMEELRREISGIGNPADPNSIRQETILKRLIDAHTEPYATGAYALARAARKEVSDKYESVSTIAQLLGTKKRTPERVIAAEKVMDRLLSGITSAANLRSLKGLLTGADGDPQAWQEVQGALVEKIRTAAYPKGTTADEAGQKSISPAALRGVVQEMDESGKLDIVFEPEVARGMRDLADTAEYAFTAPPGSVNFSNTSSAWVNAFDMIINTGIAGVPLKGGLVNNVLIPLKNAAKNREAKKEVRRLVGDNAQ